MGKIVKTVLKVAAVAAIAYFAPPLAASIGTSVGLGSVATTALAAGIGAGMGKLIPGVSTTAGMMGGLMGGINQTGLLSSTSPTAVTSAGTAPTTFTEAFSPEYMSSLGPDAAAATAPTATAAPASLGQALSGAARNPIGALGQGIRNVTGGLGAVTGATGLTSMGTAGGLNLGAIAPQLIGSALVGTPGAGLMKAQRAELERAQQMNAALTQQRLDEANKLIREADYIDPEYTARQAAEAAMIKGGIQTAEQTRGLTGERLAAERRRMTLGTARSAGTAYQQGYGTGVGARLQTRQAGIQAMPTQYPTLTGEQSTALRDRLLAQNARDAQAQGLSKLFGQALGVPKSLADLTPGIDEMVASNPEIF